MEAFPRPLELTVASALLLLSTPPPSLSPAPKKIATDCSESLVWSGSTSNSCSSSSTVTGDGSSFSEAPAERLRMVAVVARCHEMKLKVVKKKRSKRFWLPDLKKSLSGGPPKTSSVSVAETTEASSSLSTGSSGVSSARSCSIRSKSKKLNWNILAREFKWKPVGSARLRLRADAILRVLSSGCATEMKIRQMLGDSPDTSKALRMLLRREQVKRSGAGGRRDPYIYKIAC